MSSLGFDVRDYSTQACIEAPLGRDFLVLVPRRPTALPPLGERPESSVRLRERRLYFDARRTPSGIVVLPDVPPGAYSARIRAKHYLPLQLNVSAPQLQPVGAVLHRDVSYPFGPEDTLVRGLVRRASGAIHTGFRVRATSIGEPLVPEHNVPLDAAGEFVAFIPEKRTTGAVRIEVFHSAGSVSVTLPAVVLHRSNHVPIITVP